MHDHVWRTTECAIRYLCRFHLKTLYNKTQIHFGEQMSPSLADRLVEARHTRFVGRQGELSVFESALRTEILPFYILHIFGPGGVGKTTLLQEFALLSERHGARSIYLDARHIDQIGRASCRERV